MQALVSKRLLESILQGLSIEEPLGPLSRWDGVGDGHVLWSLKCSPPPSRHAWLWPCQGLGFALDSKVCEALLLRWACKRFSFKISPCLAFPVEAPSWQGAQCPGFLLFLVLHHDWPS